MGGKIAFSTTFIKIIEENHIQSSFEVHLFMFFCYLYLFFKVFVVATETFSLAAHAQV